MSFNHVDSYNVILIYDSSDSMQPIRPRRSRNIDAFHYDDDGVRILDNRIWVSAGESFFSSYHGLLKPSHLFSPDLTFTYHSINQQLPQKKPNPRPPIAIQD